MANQGLFVVIEGSDGSGKKTQFNLLSERLKATGYNVETFDFPRYDHPSSFFVRQYLGGKYGPADQISPYTSSLFYALDRYEAAKDIKRALSQGKIVLSNRYVGSNMAHQGSKFSNPVEQRGFFVWEDNLEFELLKIPRPDVSFFLRVPAGISKHLITERAARANKQLDEHERNIEHLKRTLSTYDVLCQLFPKDFKAIECTKSGELLSVAKINNLIWENLRPMLPAEKPNPSHSVVVSIEKLVDDADEQDNSNGQELTIPFKKSSLLLRMQIERQLDIKRQANFSKWSDNNYEFYTPHSLAKEAAAVFKSSTSSIASLYEALATGLADYYDKRPEMDKSAIDQILLQTTPVSALSPFVLKVRKNEVSSLCSQLLSYDTDEAQWAAKQIYLGARQKWPRDFNNALESNTAPESLNSIIANLAGNHLSNLNADNERVRLLETAPRQEFDLLAETIYPISNLPLAEITEEVSSWPYTQKYQSLKQTASAPGILSRVNYKMDVISDQISIYELSRSARLRGLQVQSLTPRYGFDIPSQVEDAGLDDLYTQIFDESLKLYSSLQLSAGRDDSEQYATLAGHKARCRFSITADNLQAIGLEIQTAEAKKLYENLIEKVCEVHPLLWEIISGASSSPAQNRDRPLSSRNRVKPSRQRSAKRRRK